VLIHEVIRFAISGEMDFMTQLLKVMAEMQAPGGMPKPFSAYDKQYLHGGFFSQHMSLMSDELLPEIPRFRRGRESSSRIRFGYDDPCKDVDDYTRSE
jgi:hypothetical protein